MAKARYLDYEGLQKVWAQVDNLFARKGDIPSEDIETLKSNYDKLVYGFTPEQINKYLGDLKVIVGSPGSEVTPENIHDVAAWLEILTLIISILIQLLRVLVSSTDYRLNLLLATN